MEIINDCVKEMQSEQIIDDILDISNGLYSSYEDYVEHKQMITEMDRKNNNKWYNPHNLEQLILNKYHFCYIVSKNNKD